jgi:orotidine-5'-phosphate decarboxylase
MVRMVMPEGMIVTPAIRPLWAAVGDQKRPTTPTDAIKAGATDLVIGRPITSPPPEIGSPAEALKRIVEEIEAAL